MDTVKLLLFGLTPRAGRRKHVYLVPETEKRTRRTIESLDEEIVRKIEAAGRSKQTSDAAYGTAAGRTEESQWQFVVVWNRVMQPSTGREAPEWLALAAQIAGKRWAKEVAEELAIWLRDKLEILAKWVETHDWERGASELFERNEYLSNWQSEAEGLIVKLVNQGPRSETSTTIHYEEFQPPAPTPPSRRWMSGVTVLGVAVVGLIFITAFFLPWAVWSDQGKPSKTPTWCWWLKREARDGFGRLLQPERRETKEQEQWRSLANAVRVKDSSIDRDIEDIERLKNLKNKILEKLRKLFEYSEKAPREYRTLTPEEEIERILQDFDRLVLRSANGASFNDLLNRQELLRNLAELFDNTGEDLDRFGLVDSVWDKQLIDWLEGLEPSIFRRLVESLRRVDELKIRNALANEDFGPDHSKVLKRILQTREEISKEYDFLEFNPKPQFWFDRDDGTKRIVLAIKDLFESSELRSWLEKDAD